MKILLKEDLLNFGFWTSYEFVRTVLLETFKGSSYSDSQKPCPNGPSRKTPTLCMSG